MIRIIIKVIEILRLDALCKVFSDIMCRLIFLGISKNWNYKIIVHFIFKIAKNSIYNWIIHYEKKNIFIENWLIYDYRL